MTTWTRWMLACLCALTLGDPARAQDEAMEEPQPEAVPVSIAMRSGEGSVELESGRLRYTWSAGTMPVLDDETGETRAEMFHIAYRVASDEPRPVTFVFNGGPGSSSVWLHMGLCGPKRIAFANEKGDPTPPPYRVIDNAYTWLAWTDLVFIDPVSTGYSRPAEGAEKSEFHGLEDDVSSVGDFIRLWTTRNDAWGAPKYLCGESYGTTRAAGLSQYLQDRHAMYLSGIVMVSSVLDFGAVRFADGNLIPPPLFLPTYCATAHYHALLADDLQQRDILDLLHEVETFAIEEYTPALMLGDRLGEERRAEIVRKVARYSGTSEAFVERMHLMPSIWRYTKELMRDKARSVGRLDSRFVGIEADPSSDSAEDDPSYDAVLGPFASAINQYLRGELGIEEDRVYEILTGKVRPWEMGSAGDGRYVNVSTRLRRAMHQNKHLRVLFQSGLYDLATPYFATDHVIAQMRLDPEIRDNVTHEVYAGGHMMYLHLPSMKLQSRRVREFYQSAPTSEIAE